MFVTAESTATIDFRYGGEVHATGANNPVSLLLSACQIKSIDGHSSARRVEGSEDRLRMTKCDINENILIARIGQHVPLYALVLHFPLRVESSPRRIVPSKLHRHIKCTSASILLQEAFSVVNTAAKHTHMWLEACESCRLGPRRFTAPAQGLISLLILFWQL
jgi:hypothetical protein